MLSERELSLIPKKGLSFVNNEWDSSVKGIHRKALAAKILPDRAESISDLWPGLVAKS